MSDRLKRARRNAKQKSNRNGRVTAPHRHSLTEKRRGIDITAKEIFKELKYAAEKSIRDNNDTIPYMSGTMRKKNMLKELIKRYMDNTIIDYELGIIDSVIYEHEMEIFNKMNIYLEYFNIN